MLQYIVECMELLRNAWNYFGMHGFLVECMKFLLTIVSEKCIVFCLGYSSCLFCGTFHGVFHGIIYGVFSKLLCREGQVLPFSQVPSYSYKHGPLSNATMTCMRMFFCDCEASWTNWICWHYRCDKCNSRRIMGQGGDADWTMISLNCKHCSPSYAYFHLVLKTVFFIEEIAGAKRMIYVSIV